MENPQGPAGQHRGLCSLLCNDFMVPRGKVGGRDKESGMDMDTLLYVTWRTRKDLLDSTGDSAQCHVAAWMEGSLGEKRYMCMYG